MNRRHFFGAAVVTPIIPFSKDEEKSLSETSEEKLERVLTKVLDKYFSLKLEVTTGKSYNLDNIPVSGTFYGYPEPTKIMGTGL